MSKIRLSISLLVSFIVSGCASTYQANHKFHLDYIGGGADGLIYSNFLKANLNSLNMLDHQSPYIIKTSINHKTDLFITNINNTSDRENITSTLTATIFNKNADCDILNYQKNVKQYYVIASNIYFASNNMAVEKIKKNNVEKLSRDFVFQLSRINKFDCIND